jgi:hypothetical protein
MLVHPGGKKKCLHAPARACRHPLIVLPIHLVENSFRLSSCQPDECERIHGVILLPEMGFQLMINKFGTLLMDL